MVATEEDVLEAFATVEKIAQKSDQPPTPDGDPAWHFFAGENWF